MIQLAQEEIKAFNLLSLKAQEAQNLLNEAIAAQKAFIALCEIKYKASYDKETGKFNPEE
jgi:hypothetical protein